MKVLLCALNSKYIHSTLAVWYLAAALKKYNNVECEVLEATINEPKEKVLEKILFQNADLVAFSTYIWNKNETLWLAKKVKDATDAKVLLGGPEVSYNAESLLKNNSFIDYIISGEGEEPLSQLCSGVPIELIDGVSFKKGGEVFIKQPFFSSKNPPNPYSQKYLDTLNGRIAYIETSRGCPFHCAFCLSGRCEGVKFFDLEESKKNIILLANSGTQTVKFIDRTFNANKKRAREIFEFIIDQYGKSIPENVCFHFEIEGELLDTQTVNLLARAPKGLIQFEIGLQSFNEQTLIAVNRRTNLDLLCENIKKLLMLGNIHVHIDLIIGLPYENLNSFKRTFDLAYRLKPHMLQVGFLKLLYGAELREKNNYKYEFIDTPPYEITSNDWLTNTELQRLHRFEDAFEKMYNSRRFGLTLEYLVSVFESPFEMFMEFSDYIDRVNVGNSLDDFTKAIFEYFSQVKSVDGQVLRDKLAVDRLATNRMGYLPSFLRVYSPKIKEALNELEKNDETKKRKNVKRAATVLLTENKLAYVDYDTCDYVTNRFLVKFTEI
ncbi:MAG: DUF4080 domain-containing protein [Ruminococcaceae bacterium]|nr:DUF4080 domain-containing protein [Oscillospiraceae bacterium]